MSFDSKSSRTSPDEAEAPDLRLNFFVTHANFLLKRNGTLDKPHAEKEGKKRDMSCFLPEL